MGIEAFCPNGHRVKVKNELAGRKGICPQCQSRFRIPRADGLPAGGRPRSPEAARVVSLDPAVVASLPRAFAVEAAATPHAEPPVPPRALHAVLAEQPAATWSIAVPGGEASPPMSAEAMQSVLDAGGLTGAELVWREGWADWVSIGRVFPECVPQSG